MDRQERQRAQEREERTTPPRLEILSPDYYDAIIFELGALVEDLTEVQFQSWKEVFDTLLRTREGRDFSPFTREEFHHHIEGRPRIQAIESFLGSRAIALPGGRDLHHLDEALQHNTESLYGLAQMREVALRKHIESGHLKLRPGADELLHNLVRANLPLAMVSPSRMATRIAQILKIEPLFDQIIDGRAFEGKDPLDEIDLDLFAEALTRLGTTASATAVIEDEGPHLSDSRLNSFALTAVIGSNDRDSRKSLLRRGADLVLSDLNGFHVRPGPPT